MADKPHVSISRHDIELTGVLMAMGFDVDVVAERGDEVCDLCRAPDPTWVYICHTFSLPIGGADGPDYAYSPDWAVCETCDFLIRKDNRQLLRERATDAGMGLWPGAPRDRVRADVAIVHDMFFSNWTGVRYPNE